VLIEAGLIRELGNSSDLESKAATIIDANGQAAIPGLIDSHIHPVVGDWTPRMNTFGWLESYSQAGITTAVSQGSWHQGAYPDDRQGMVALGITLARAFRDFRPGRMKVHGAAVSLVEGLTVEDFDLLADQGVWLIAEIGSRSIIDPHVIRPMLDIAHARGFVSRVHFGPEAVAGTYTVTAEMALAMGAQIASHVNGGPSSPPLADLDAMVDESDCFLELSYPGNHKALFHLVQRVMERGELKRLIGGSDTPTGAGVLPRAILQTAVLLAAFADLSPEQAVAAVTGNTARAYGLNTGILEPGREADLLLIDAPKGSGGRGGLDSLKRGDVPSVSLLMIDGKVVSLGTKNTLPARTLPTIRSA
jgi:enamidase